MRAVELIPFKTAGLGDTSYLLGSEGEAVIIDPQRDAWRFVEEAKARGWRITHVLETHVHNDYVSGAIETRAATGAEIVAPARGKYEFELLGADEGDVIEVGAVRLTAAATPGHTPEHLSWFVDGFDAPPEGSAIGNGHTTAPPTAVFSGGSLLVGSVGRTDLLGPVLAPAMAADQQRTLRRFAALPDTVAILPTHGAGSFCSAGPVSGQWYTSVGNERASNPVFAAAGAAEGPFRDLLTAGLGRYPAYYAHMAGINRAGPRVLGGLRLPGPLSPAAVADAVGRGARVVDGRDRASFARGHVAGSINIELNDDFASYVGWLVPFGSAVVLVLPEPAEEAAAEAVTQLLRIGYEWATGWLDGGVEAWERDGRELGSYEIVGLRDAAAEAAAAASTDADPDAATASTILDVRQPREWQDDGVIAGASRIFVADLPARIAELPRDRPVTVLCRSGHRASIAASLLDGAGYDVRLVARGGAPNWPLPLVSVGEQESAGPQPR
jgi:glyoxylase-like metal-dependent hydrolase (beta-lactamase superfamily II)/rhodanese-related sulfurtransferase